MRKISVLATVAIGVLFLVEFALPTGIVAAADPTPTTPGAKPACDANRAIHVSGTAMINAAPDRALLQLGVQSNSTTVEGAQRDNSRAMQRVIAAVQGQGVEAKDIATDQYRIEPIYEDFDALYIKGYRIHNSLAVTVRDVSKAGSVLAAALAAGANQVNDVSFYTTELRKYRDQARELAMRAAGEKARALAGAAGAETGCVVNITENSWSYYNGWWYGSSRNSNQWTQNVIQNAAPASVSSSGGSDEDLVSLGMISVKAEVGVTYALK